MTKKKLTDIGKNAPSNFKFAMIVSLVIFWTEFLKNLVGFVFDNYLGIKSNLLTSFLTALFFTFLTYFLIRYYRKILNILKKIRVDD